ncbi:MAG TPA: pyridoxamine 5'-phosphate oxidase family protein [Candidatus Limnocylindria bacterium]|nr:pyridoxamine 5'-phosphate oxidase family protein [Candidatus Limnocylindria bacterium]
MTVRGEPWQAVLASERGAWAREHLEHDIVGWLTTTAGNGQPQTSVISFLWEWDSLIFYSKPGTPKLRNIARNPLVSFHLQSDAHGDDVLTIEGRAAVDRDIPPSDVYAPYQAKYAQPLAHWKMDEAETARDFSVPIRIRPTRVRID